MKDNHWRPSADIETLKLRARLLQDVRRFFVERDVLEVETPVLSRFGSTEVHLEHFEVVPGTKQAKRQYLLNTSAELAMKRLLAAGSGDIYQISKVFRAHEQGSRHQPEFTMLEWYRVGFDLDALMGEVELLIKILVGKQLSLPRVFYSYVQVFNDVVQLDPLNASLEQLRACFKFHTGSDAPDSVDKQDCLDLIMSYVIEPGFNPEQITFVTHYPAEQAALARLNAENPDVAERFEAFAGGMELANGFHELTDVNEQRQRMRSEIQDREKHQKGSVDIDEHFLAALEQGLPDCSGVAIGFDRMCMVALGKQRIDEVMSFTIDYC